MSEVMNTTKRGSLLAVASTTDCFLDILNGHTLDKVARIEGLISQPHEIAWDSVRRLMYLTHTYRAGGYGETPQEKAHEISVIGIDTAEVVDVIDISPYRAPHDVAYDPRRDLIYAGVEAVDGRNGVVVIDAKSRAIIDNIPLTARNAHWISLTSDVAKLYVSHKEAEVVTAIDLDTRTAVAVIPCPGGAEEIDCSPSAPYAYVATPVLNVTNNVSQGALNRNPPKPGDPTPRLLKIDTSTDTVVASLDFDELICAVHVAPSGDVLVSEMHFPEPSASGDEVIRGFLHVVDGETMTRSARLLLDELPFTSRTSPDGTRAVVANLKTGTASIIDLGTPQVVTTIDNNAGTRFGGTHGLCWVEGVEQ